MAVSKYNKSKLFPVVLLLGFFFIGVVLFLHPRNSLPQVTVPNEVISLPVISGEVLEFIGEMVCLPHKNTSGPQTMECAYGLKTPEGMYYALRDSDPSYKHISGVAMGKKVAVKGRFIPQEDKIYPIEGIIEVQRIDRI